MEEDISTYGRDSPNPVARMVRLQPGIQEGYFSGSSPWLAGELKRVGAFTKLSNLEMYAYISVPAGYLAQRWWQHNLAVLISFVAFFGLFIAIAYLVTKREGLHSRELVE